MKIGVVGASGYAGGELLRLLASHPEFEAAVITAGSNAGEEITSIHPQLSNYAGRKFESSDAAKLKGLDLVFTALPHGESAKLINQLDPNQKVVDLGADFRLKSKEQWQKYYGGEHAGSWTYGLPELANHREQIKASNRVANPGCYATVIALATAPMLPFVDASDIVVVAASGTTGAGNNAGTPPAGGVAPTGGFAGGQGSTTTNGGATSGGWCWTTAARNFLTRNFWVMARHIRATTSGALTVLSPLTGRTLFHPAS